MHNVCNWKLLEFFARVYGIYVYLHICAQWHICVQLEGIFACTRSFMRQKKSMHFFCVDTQLHMDVSLHICAILFLFCIIAFSIPCKKSLETIKEEAYWIEL
jgi:hypothetical protein